MRRGHGCATSEGQDAPRASRARVRMLSSRSAQLGSAGARTSSRVQGAGCTPAVGWGRSAGRRSPRRPSDEWADERAGVWAGEWAEARVCGR
eukprot:1144750-Prorocentrum_minimum.AAC.1